MKIRWSSARVLSLILVFLLAGWWQPAPALSAAFSFDIPGPPNSGIFGETVTVLPNGNFVVTDPDYPFYTNYTEAKGAVYLYNPDGVLISRLAGDRVGNSVGSGGITVLANGNYVVNSPFWDSATTDGVGAVTWCSQATGCNGTVSALNSLVGSSSGDLVGYAGVTALANGNYVVSSSRWRNGSVLWAGAVTWGNGAGGTTGVVSALNSLVGSHANDWVGDATKGGVIALKNGNYLVLDYLWDNGSAVDAGAVAWGNGAGGTAGAVSALNSLVGSTANDNVGDTFWGRLIELTNSSYVVVSPSWDLDGTHANTGAVTWGSGTAGVSGPISASNSLVGNSANVSPGAHFEVTVLTNSNYVVTNSYWSPDGTNAAWGAVTWGSGATGVSGQISASNSLVGSAASDNVGSGNFFGDGGVIALNNGNYVVNSYWWNDQGAVTWGNGASGVTGPVSISNSLVGTQGASDVVALANGNYAASSPCWYDKTPGSIYVSAVTWGNGTTGTTGEVSTANSLVSVDTGNCLGTDGGLVALTNGNYVWINLGIGVTWVNGSHVTTGVVSIANSLVGGEADDEVGGGLYGGGVKALANGNYVVISPGWDNGGVEDAGAVTWGDGANGTTGLVSALNSLVGSTANDELGSTGSDGAVTVLANGNYVVSAPQWDNGGMVDAGAVAWGNGAGGTIGPLSASNSLVGSTASDRVGNGSFWGDPGVTALPNGSYIVNSPKWAGPAGQGAVTWGDGTSGLAGAVSASNSLVNTCPVDPYCGSEITAYPDGGASIHLPKWNIGSRYGAVSLMACGPVATVGPVGMSNSVLGRAANGGSSMVSGYVASRPQLIVGRPKDNKVTIQRCQAGITNWLYLPLVLR
jgi:hypothetical protein